MKKNHNNQKRAALAKKRHAKNLARKDKTYNGDTAMRIAFARALEKSEQQQQKQTAAAGETVIVA